LLTLISKDFTLLNRLMFSDEAHFQLNGLVNKQNHRFWNDKEPGAKAVVEHEQFPKRLTVWAAIGVEGIIGPVFNPCGAKNTVTGESYLRLLKEVGIMGAPSVNNWPPPSGDASGDEAAGHLRDGGLHA